MLLVCAFKGSMGKLTFCENSNIMHYIVLQTVQIYVTFYRETSHKQCLRYHKSKFFPD